MVAAWLEGYIIIQYLAIYIIEKLPHIIAILPT